MANIDQIISQIRFQLEQLSSKNAHYSFEHLCRHLARARICSNILPATGPVSVGGDQGKDFETFRTYLQSSPIAESSFIGLISDKPLTFACTLQNKGIKSKIKADVTTIMSPGTTVKGIHYFCTVDIAISLRHDLEKWTKEKYNSELTIYDGQAISELLADQEVFWIAENYLGIPNEIFPRNNIDDNWYSRALESWKSKDLSYLNYHDYFEAKTAIRHATFSKNLKIDLNFWIEKLKEFINNKKLLQLKRKAIYEISVASLRGQGSLHGYQKLIREYFKDIKNLYEPNDLEDATNLLNYCIPAYFNNLVSLKIGELVKWGDEIRANVEENLKRVENPNLLCQFLEIRGFVELNTNPKDPILPKIDNAIAWWLEMIKVAKDAPLFPLERFADRLTHIIEIFGIRTDYNETDFENLSQQLDILIEKRFGGFKAAEKCRDRALKYYKNNEILKAINQLHQSKIKWFADETLKASVISMLLISNWYAELGLLFAAKYYSLAAAFISAKSKKSELKEYISKSLIMATDYNYLHGSWIGFLDFTIVGLRAYGLYGNEDNANEIDDEFNRTLYHVSILLTVTKQLDLPLYEFVADVVKHWSIDDYLKELLPNAEKYFTKDDISDLWEDIIKQLEGRPYGDLGPERKVIWSELGIEWEIKFLNDYSTTAIAEQFIAVFQILLADLSNVDLCLLKTKVHINILVDDIQKFSLKSLPSNVGRKWELVFPSSFESEGIIEMGEVSDSHLTVASSILSEISLLSYKNYEVFLKDSFRNGISMKVFVGKPYSFLYREFISEENFNLMDRASKKIPEKSRYFEIKTNRELSWRSGDGPGYNKDDAKKYIENRYKHTIVSTKYTLPKLMKDKNFVKTILKLKSEGWLDWHILLSVASISANYRVQRIPGVYGNLSLQKKYTMKFMLEEEDVNAISIPVEEFSEAKLKMHLEMSMPVTIKNYGLECRQNTPDLEGISHFLGERFNYWTDDIDHDNPFKE